MLLNPCPKASEKLRENFEREREIYNLFVHAFFCHFWFIYQIVDACISMFHLRRSAKVNPVVAAKV